MKEKSTDGFSLEDITYNYEKDNKQVRKQLDKDILYKKGAWATLGIKYQNLDNGVDEFKKPCVTIARYKYSSTIWRKQSNFNISDKEQAEAIIKFLKKAFNIK